MAGTMSANLNPNLSHGGHGVYGGHGVSVRKFYVFPPCAPFPRVLRVGSFEIFFGGKK